MGVIAWVILLFLIFRSVGTILYWIVASVAFMLYHLLLAFKFAKVGYEARQHESIELN